MPKPTPAAPPAPGKLKAGDVVVLKPGAVAGRAHSTEVVKSVAPNGLIRLVSGPVVNREWCTKREG